MDDVDGSDDYEITETEKNRESKIRKSKNRQKKN